MSDSIFPANFLWGAATSAYQVEGSPLADGAGESNWHRFSHTPGKIVADQNGDVACDHYRRFVDDVRLMRDLSLQAYRFSIGWSRVLPHGTGRTNPAGLDFYKRLVDSLLEHRIEPMVTLHHWDLPQALDDRGGWANPQSPDWFVEFAQLMFHALGDRVSKWVTINEPWVIVDQGYIEGRHAPGRRDLAQGAMAAKNLLKAHAAAVAAYRAIGKNSIGLVVNLTPVHAASDTPGDRDAANRLDAYINRQFLDPVLLGELPPELPAMFGEAWHEWTAEELRQVQYPIDFIGVNYYLRLVVCDDPQGGLTRTRTVRQPKCPYTAMGWEIYPSGLVDTLQWLNDRYGRMALYITENGAAFEDQPALNGAVCDSQRVEYLRNHLRAARRAIQAGVNLRGYFVWSLLDNFEWACGYSKRFGIVHVDFETQRRTAKASASYYADVIRTGGGGTRLN